MRSWIPLSMFQQVLKDNFETKEEILDLLEISRPTIDRFMREEIRFLPYLPILSRKVKISENKLYNLLIK